MKPILFFLVLVLFGFNHFCSAQTGQRDTNQIYLITKLDGTEYIGKILSDDGREVLIETEAIGKIYIPKSEIKTIQKIEDATIKNKEGHGTAGPFTTRYYFTTNALPIEKGEDYAMVHLYGPEVHFSLSNNFSLGIMSTWLASPAVLAAKYSIKTKNEKLNFSIGTLAGTTGYLNMFRGFAGLHWANITFGSRTKNITFSAGYGYLQTGNREHNYTEGTYIIADYEPPYTEGLRPIYKSPIFSIAGIVKIGKKTSFVFDSMVGFFNIETFNYTSEFISDGSGITPPTFKYIVTKQSVLNTAFFIMPGMRFQSTDRRAFQVALAGVSVFRSAGENYSFPVPMCSWFFKF